MLRVRKRAFIIHPFLFAVFPILFLYSHNIEQIISIKKILPCMVIMLVITALFLCLLKSLGTDAHKAGMIISLLLILFFWYGHIFDAVQSLGFEKELRHKDMLRAYAVILGLVLFFTLRTPKKLNKLTNILNVMASCLILICLIDLGIGWFSTIDYYKTEGLKNKPKVNDKDTAVSKTIYRDIYYIILDGYANSETLKEIFDYDNSEFTNFLAHEGFYTAFKSKCNYPCSYLSLASSLNMQYLDEVQKTMKKDSKDVKLLIEKIRNNEVVLFFKNQGYKYIHFSNYWEPTKENELADLNIGIDEDYRVFFSSSEFMTILAGTTMLKATSLSHKQIAVGHRHHWLNTFSKLAMLSEIKAPKFVFAHIMLPHPPYIFDRKGDEITESESTGSNWEPKSQYLDQLIFVNEKVKILIKNILSKSKTSPIIVIQSDHGPAFSGNKFSPEFLQERIRILNTYYLPGIKKGLLYDSISPVNTFRLILRNYFGKNYDLLEDRVYFTNTDESFYDFQNITELVSTYN